MIEALKRKLVDVLQRKEVSLALIFDRQGRILWHAGRSVRGDDVRQGGGFPRSAILKVLETGEGLEEEAVVEASDLSRSAKALFIRSLWVRPVGAGLFLYVDSGSRDSFDAADRQVFDTLGGLLAEALDEGRRRSASSGGLSGPSPQMAEVRDLVARYALEEEAVLIVGETGVGKNRVAELIHRISGRRGPFVVAHAPSIAEDLIERELFGHRRGAFTGADGDRPGLFDEAKDGTLLLDEITEVPLAVQAKLLRVAESLRFRPVGATKESEACVRLLAATNRDLATEVKEHRFRPDLYFRLSVLCLRVPPLRERPADVRALAEENVRLLRGKRLDEEAFSVLTRYAWPGNVRELLHVLTRAGIELDAPVIGGEIARFLAPPEASVGRDPLSLVRTRIAAGSSFWDVAWPAFLDRELNREQLTLLLREGFEACGSSLKRLAAELNIRERDYSRFVATLHKYDIHPRRRDAG
jgi:DNA-binding NtrC family response regulator